MRTYVAYYRTSTNQQTLGLDSQKSVVDNYINQNGGEPIAEIKEQESGKNDDRVGLEKAIRICEQTGSILTIAKLDRLSRSISFLFQLRDRVSKNNIEIKALDMPSFSTISLGIYATMAQAEREVIASRTRNALQALKDSGVVLGNPENFKHEHRLKGAQAVKEKSANNKINIQATALIVEYREKKMSYDKIAAKLSSLNFKTVTGKDFTSTGVMRLYKRHLNNVSSI